MQLIYFNHWKRAPRVPIDPRRLAQAFPLKAPPHTLVFMRRKTVAVQEPVGVKEYGHYINGEWVPSESGQWFETKSPTTGKHGEFERHEDDVLRH